MMREVWLLDEVEVEVSGFFTTHHSFQTQSGDRGELTFPAFGQEGIFRTHDGRELRMYKTSWLGSAHELAEGEVVRGWADRRGLFSRDMVLQYDGREYILQPEGFWKQSWTLADAGGHIVLEIQPRGILRQGATLTIPSAVDADLVAFAYYLFYVRQQEDAAAGAAAAS